MKITKKTLSKRLWTQTGAMLCNIFLVGGIAYWSSLDLKKEIKVQSDVMVPASRLVGFIDMVHDGVRGSVLNGFYIASKLHTEEGRKLKEEASAELQEYTKLINGYLSELKTLELSSETL